MWTSTMELDLKKFWLTHLVGRFYRNIYFSSYSPLQVQNLPRQSLPDSNWVRIRNRLAGICGSDLHLLYGDGDFRIAPAALPNHQHLYPGHEVVGEVIEIGEDVQRLRVGDRVVLQSGPNCISANIQPICRSCSAGNFNLCEHGAFIAPQPIGGGWSEEMLLHEQQLYRVPPTLSDEQAVMLEPTAVALHALLRRLPRPGEKVLIIGAGTIGLLTLKALRALVPQVEVSVMARHSFQVEQATRAGAAHIIYQQDAYTSVQRATQARLYKGLLNNRTLVGGYDVIFDTIGQKDTIHHALRWARAQGTVVLVGIHLHPINLDLSPIWYQEINLIGSTSHGVERWPLDRDTQQATYDVVVDLLERSKIAPEQLITHHFALDNYQHALLTATKKAESRAIKVVFDYSLLPASVVPNVRASAPRKRRSTVDFSSQYLDHLNLEEDLERQRAQSSINRTPPLRPLTGEDWSEQDAQELDESDDTATAIPTVQRKTMSVPLSRSAEFEQLSRRKAVRKTSVESTPLPTSLPEPLVPAKRTAVPNTPMHPETVLATGTDQDAQAHSQEQYPGQDEDKTQRFKISDLRARKTNSDVPETPRPEETSPQILEAIAAASQTSHIIDEQHIASTKDEVNTASPRPHMDLATPVHTETEPSAEIVDTATSADSDNSLPQAVAPPIVTSDSAAQTLPETPDSALSITDDASVDPVPANPSHVETATTNTHSDSMAVVVPETFSSADSANVETPELSQSVASASVETPVVSLSTATTSTDAKSDPDPVLEATTIPEGKTATDTSDALPVSDNNASPATQTTVQDEQPSTTAQDANRSTGIVTTSPTSIAEPVEEESSASELEYVSDPELVQDSYYDEKSNALNRDNNAFIKAEGSNTIRVPQNRNNARNKKKNNRR